MKKLLVAVLVLSLGGCALDPFGRSIFEGGSSFTTPITTPVGRRELAEIENAYGIALAAAVNYRRYCYGKPISALPDICRDRRNIVLTMQQYDQTAQRALRAARNFIRNNPTISAVSAIAAARQAVADFQQAARNQGVLK